MNGKRETGKGKRLLPASYIVVVHVQPRASRTEVVGRYGDAIKIRLAAPPVDGAANEELIRFLAEHVDVPRSAVRLVGGHTGRRKRVAIEGLSPGEIDEKLGARKEGEGKRHQ